MAHVGPLPLTGGVQLEAAEGRADGLLRALNVEARNNALCPRKGAEFIGSTPFGSVTTGYTHPASWAGQSVTYMGFAAIPQPDATLSWAVGSDALETVESLVTYEFFGDDDAWHPCEVLNQELLGAGRMEFFAVLVATAKSANLRMIVPSGWKSAQPTPTPSSRYWLRVTRASGVWSAGVTTQSVNPHTGSTGVIARPSKVYSFNSRAGPRCVVASPYYNGTSSLWDVFDLDDGLEDQSVLAFAIASLSLSGSIAAQPGDVAALLYQPSTDEVLIMIGTEQRVWDLKTNVGRAFAAAYGATAPAAYSDIPLEATIPVAKVLVTFGGRTFLMAMAGDPHGIRWSAPGEFYDVWPSSNYGTLASKGSGHIVGAAELHGVLYAFTQTSIFALQLGDGTGNNESDLFINLVEETGCLSGETVVACNGAIIFLSHDGVRAFNGQRSRLLSDPVRDLFRPESEHPQALRRHAGAVAAWHQVENQYRLFYASAGSAENDCDLRIDLDDRTCWLGGADAVSGLDTSGATGPIGQRLRGVRVTSAAWHPTENVLKAVDAYGLAFVMDRGGRDVECPVQAVAETQHFGFGKAAQRVLTRVDLTVRRDNFAAMQVSVIPDGDRSREDARTINVNTDALDTDVAADAASSTGEALLQLEESWAPVTMRVRCKGRNHRVRIETVGPTHAPFAVGTLEADADPWGAR